MEYKVEYDINSDVCVVQVSGVHKRPQESQELLRIAGTFAAEHGCSRFLFDMREATIVGGTMDAYETVVDHKKYGFSKLFRIAAVYPAITENEKFMENVGVNRGAAAYQVFDDIRAARDWIAKK
jgi:hypothetical protein